MVGVFLKTHVLELKTEIVFYKKKGYACERAIKKSLIIPFCCFCSHVCSHKSAFMSHYESKQADIKLKAPFSRR